MPRRFSSLKPRRPQILQIQQRKPLGRPWNEAIHVYATRGNRNPVSYKGSTKWSSTLRPRYSPQKSQLRLYSSTIEAESQPSQTLDESPLDHQPIPENDDSHFE